MENDFRFMRQFLSEKGPTGDAAGRENDERRTNDRGRTTPWTVGVAGAVEAETDWHSVVLCP